MADAPIDPLRRFSPCFRFHPKETYYPVSYELYITQANLKDETTGIDTMFQLTPQRLAEWVRLTSPDVQKKHTLYLPKGHDAPVAVKGEPLDINGRPVYVTTSRTTPLDMYNTYYHFYAYNDSLPIGSCGWPRVGDLWADLELVQVHLKRPDTQCDWFVERVYFSQHGGGEWVGNGDLEFTADGLHPIAYVALYSHATYPQRGPHHRYAGFVKDDCSDDGLMWISRNQRLITGPAADGHFWFAGDLGDGHVDGFVSQPAFMCPAV